MKTVILTTDFQVEIPRDVRERVELVPGQEFKVHLHGDHILLVPVRKKDSGRGYSSLRENSLVAVN